jgi:hypothetical protein
VPLFVFVNILIIQVPQHHWVDPTVSQYSGAIWIMVKIHLVSLKVSLDFSKV